MPVMVELAVEFAVTACWPEVLRRMEMPDDHVVETAAVETLRALSARTWAATCRTLMHR